MKQMMNGLKGGFAAVAAVSAALLVHTSETPVTTEDSRPRELKMIYNVFNALPRNNLRLMCWLMSFCIRVPVCVIVCHSFRPPEINQPFSGIVFPKLLKINESTTNLFMKGLGCICFSSP